MPKPFYHTIVIDLHIVYDGTYYFYNRHENGRIMVDADRITAERAGNIIQLNEDDPAVEVSTRGRVQIGSPHGWSWMAKIVVHKELADV